MRKLIHSDFELDLSNFKLSVQKENFWFSEGFFTSFSFPFEMELTDELDALLGFISRYNSVDPKIYIECKHYHNNEISDAILEIEQLQDRISGIIRFGYEQLPNFDKKLSELPLDKFELPEGVDIYEHAETIIPQTWPAVNYNFPQIHTDKIDPDNDDVFFAFEKIINNRKDGAFLINEVLTEGGEDVTYNRNIMQPLPYWLHVLKKLFQDVGLTLSGEILNDSRFQKKLLFADVDYATTVTQESISIITMSEDAVETNNFFSRYEVTETITNPGRYRIIGTIKLYNFNGSYVKLKYRNQVIWNFNGNFGSIVGIFSVINLNVNTIFDTLADLEPNTITIESYQRFSTEQVIFQLDINPIRLHDAEGNPIPTIINKNEIDLTKTVPDMTCGDFIKVIKNWYNYDLKVEGTTAIMNKVESKINYDDAIDLSAHEVKFPLRKFQKGKSFLLKFQDVDSKDYTFLPVFQSTNGTFNSSFVPNEKTTTIEVNALPLPLLVRNGVQTAHAFQSDNSKPFAVIYDGLTSGLNLAKDPFDILIPQVHQTNYKKWFQLQINAQEFKWPLRMFAEEYQKLKSNSKIFAYNRYHVVKNINDTEVAPDEFEIELETVTLE